MNKLIFIAIFSMAFADGYSQTYNHSQLIGTKWITTWGLRRIPGSTKTNLGFSQYVGTLEFTNSEMKESSYTLQQNVAEGCLKGITLEISLYKRNNYITLFRLSLICCKGKYLLERGQIFFWVFCKFFSLCFFSYFFCRFLLPCREFEVSLQPFCANESVCATHYKNRFISPWLWKKTYNY